MEFGQFLSPCDPREIVGVRTDLSDYRLLLRGLRDRKLTVHGATVVGPPGFGRSSLINAFRQVSIDEHVTPIALESMAGTRGSNVIQDLYVKLQPHLEERKKRRFARGSDQLPAIPALDPTKNPKPSVDAFISELKSQPLSTPVAVYLDDVDRFITGDLGVAIQALVSIMKETPKEGIPLLLVLGLSEKNWKLMEDLLVAARRFSLDRLEFSDAELLLRNVGGELMRNSELRKEIVRISDRSPFQLMFAVEVTQALYDEMKTENSKLFSFCFFLLCTKLLSQIRLPKQTA